MYDLIAALFLCLSCTQVFKQYYQILSTYVFSFVLDRASERMPLDLVYIKKKPYLLPLSQPRLELTLPPSLRQNPLPCPVSRSGYDRSSGTRL
jgi:hypothetical protein